MNRMNEMMVFQQLLQQIGGASVWTYAVYLAGMFAAVLWRREVVVRWGAFRASYLLFAAAMVLPAAVQPALTMAMMSGGQPGTDMNILLSAVNAGLGPLLFAAAVVCGLGSMMPLKKHHAPSGSPPQHPLD